MKAIEAPQVVQPPCASEPDPVKRLFQELRRAPEDRMYPILAAKQASLGPILLAWQVDPARVRPLCGWGWIRETLTNLPIDTVVPSSHWIGIAGNP